jgi:protein TonB
MKIFFSISLVFLSVLAYYGKNNLTSSIYDPFLVINLEKVMYNEANVLIGSTNSIEAVFSQEDTLVYENPDPEPEFPGGFDSMMVWIQQDLILDEERYANMGQFCFTHVFLDFVVEKDGSISNIKAHNKCSSDLSYYIELFERSPKWTPGKYKGQIVRSRYRLPLTIELN